MLLAFWDDGGWQAPLTAAIIGLIAYALVLWVAALVWTYRDIASRTRDTFTQTMSLIIVLVFNLPGLLLYLILRPKETLADTFDRQLEAEALLHEIQKQATCPSCRRKIDADFVSCPFCRTPLRQPCEACGKPLSASWVLCPFCAHERPMPQAADDRTTPIRPRAMAGSPAPDPAPTDIAARPKRASTATYTPPAPKAAAPADAPTDGGS